MTNEHPRPEEARLIERRVDPGAAGAVPPTGGTSLPRECSAVHESDPDPDPDPDLDLDRDRDPETPTRPARPLASPPCPAQVRASARIDACAGGAEHRRTEGP
jgi:hypothetical protein